MWWAHQNMKTQKCNCMALAALILVCVGLVSAGFSEPPSSLYDHAGELQSTVLVFAGLGCTFIGVVLLAIVARKTTASMAPDKKSRTNVGVGLGVVLQLAALLVQKTGAGPEVAAPILLLLSIPVVVWGCMSYAEGKGRSKWLGLIGVAGIIGLAVLTVLPEQQDGDAVDPGEPESDATDGPPQV